MKKIRGFTLTELMMSLAVLGIICAMGFGAFVLIHFFMKMW